MWLYFKLQYFSFIFFNYCHLHFLYCLMKKRNNWCYILHLFCGSFFNQKTFWTVESFNCIARFWFHYCNHINTHSSVCVHTHTHTYTKRENKKAKGARKKTNKQASRGVSKNSSYNQKEIAKCLCSSSLCWTKAQYL